jgi:branched-chain amino acid transport system substrate-binding protein
VLRELRGDVPDSSECDAMIRIAAVLLAVLLGSVPLSGRAADPFEINVIIALTGPGAFLAKDQQVVLSVIEDQVNKSGGIRGRPIKFAIADDQSSPQVGVQLMNQAIAKKAQVVIGSTLVAICGAMAPLAKDGPVLYCLSPGLHPAEGSYAFSSEPSTSDAFAGTAIYFTRKGWHKVALITSSDATGQDAARGIDEAFRAQGGLQIVDRETFNITDVTVAAQMARIKASGADALIAWSTGPPIATVLRSYSDVGVTLPIVIGNGNITFAQMKAYAGILPKELYFPGFAALVPDQLPAGVLKRRAREFTAALAAAGARAESGHVSAWDPALLVLDAYRKLGFDATAAQIRQYIANLRGWVGADGTYDFRAIPQRGVGAGSIVMIQWDAARENWVGVSKPGGEPLNR